VTSQIDRLNAALAGHYRIERELGQGGMATVYLCEDVKHDRKVALKLLKPELAAVLGADRFVHEIKTTAALQHPHILPLFDSGAVDGFLYYVMPFIDGETLRTKLNRETQLSVDEAVRIAVSVCDALDYAHRHGVIHRDIKPENILLHDGRPMVADFGIALAVSAAAGGRMTETGLSLGTPHYMSPEQATAEKEITARSDVYSIGSVLYEMLTGNPPHVGANAQQIIMKIITEPAESVTKYRKSVPANVAAAVAKSLEKLPADRFASAKAFADALGNPAFANVGGTVSVTGMRGQSPRSRRAAFAWLGATVLALIAAAAAGWNMHKAPPRQVVRFPVTITFGQRLANAREVPFALSPDGTRLVYSAFDSGAVLSTLHIRALDQLTTTEIPGTERAIMPFFSPDGLWIGFVTEARELKKVAVNGGPVSPLATSVDRRVGTPSWGDDHSIVYTDQAYAYRVGDGGGAPTPLFESQKKVLDSTGMRVMSPFVLPGGQAVLMTMCSNPTTCNLVAIERAKGKVKVLVPGAVRGWYLPGGYLVYGTQEGALFAVRFNLRSLAVTSAPLALLDGIQTSGPLPFVEISASGTMVYLPGIVAGANVVIVQVDRRGQEQVIVSKRSRYQRVRLSPDGRRLVIGGFDAKEVAQVWIHDRASGTTRQLTFEGTNLRPDWSPDGTRVAFSGQHAGNVWHVWSAPADGSAPPVREGEGRDVTGSTAVSYTRDGKWIVVDGPPDDGKGAGNEDIFAIPTSGSPRTMRPAVASPFNEESGEVSPDGKWIAYVSDETGKSQVYMQPFLAPGGRTLISDGPATEAAWTSNNELVYIDNENDSLTSAHLEFGATITVTRKALFSVRPYQLGSRSNRSFDVSRDGASFIFLKSLVTDKTVDPVVVLNWAEEVKRLMAAAGIR
jgi:serine/threonine-protein kinase